MCSTRKKCDKGRCSGSDAVGDRDRFLRKMFLKQKWLQAQKAVGELLRLRGGDTDGVKRARRLLTKNKTITFCFFASTADSERSDADDFKRARTEL